MRPAVLAKWIEFSAGLEGRIYRMYPDVFGYITTGIGFEINSIAKALQFDWQLDSDGSPAPEQVVREDWSALKQRKDLVGKWHTHAAEVTRIHLTDAEIDRQALRRVRINFDYMVVHHFPDLANFPADAQLALMSIGWAYGAGFPGLDRFRSRDFEELANAREWLKLLVPDADGDYPAKISERNNPGVIERNRRNWLCLLNAQTVDDYGLDADVLHWPNEAPAPPAKPVPPLEMGEQQFTGLPDEVIEAMGEMRRKDAAEK